MLARAREAGLAAMLAIGNGDTPAEVDCAIPYAEQHDWIWATIGIHPHEARLADRDAYEKMSLLARHPRVLAWGEIGLDYHYDHSPREVQRQVLTEQMELAAAAKNPIIIHCRPSDNSRNAWDDLWQLLRQHWMGNGLGGILHCFTGQEEDARAALDMGFMISFAGNITYPKAQNIRKSPLKCHSTGFLSRPIRLILRRFLIAASAMNRLSWSRWRGKLPNCGAARNRR